MSYIYLNPQTISTAKEWCDKITPYLEKFGYIPQLTSDDQWKEWAVRIQGIPGISSRNPPSPDAFENWQDWACRFLGCLNA